jgi:hypothetical protein
MAFAFPQKPVGTVLFADGYRWRSLAGEDFPWGSGSRFPPFLYHAQPLKN